MEMKEDIINNGWLWGGGLNAQEPSSISACHRFIKKERLLENGQLMSIISSGKIRFVFFCLIVTELRLPIMPCCQQVNQVRVNAAADRTLGF